MINRFFLLAHVALLSVSIASAQEKNVPDFMSKFQDAAVKDVFPVMKDLVEKNPEKANLAFFAWEASWCRASLVEGDIGAENSKHWSIVLDQLGLMNKLHGRRSNFLIERFRWLRELTPEQRKAKLELQDRINTGFPLFETAQKSRSEKTVMASLPVYGEWAQFAVTATDNYWEAQAYYTLSLLFDMVPSNENYFKSCYYAKKAMDVGARGHSADEIAKMSIGAQLQQVASRGKIRADLIDVNLDIDPSYQKYQEDLSKPVTVADPASGGEGGTPGATVELDKIMPPKPTAHKGPIEWADHNDFKITFKRPSALTPNWQANAHWYFWYGTGVKKGETVAVPFIPGEVEIENDSGKLQLYPHGKAKGKPERIKVGSRPKAEKFDANYKDGSKASVSHVMMLMPSRFKMAGFDLGVSGDVAAIRLQGSSTAVGKIRNTEISVVDDNANGAFNDFGFDSVVIGKGSHEKIVPLSKYLEIDGLFYEVNPDPAGKKMTSRQYDGQIAPLKFEYKGNMMPKFMIAVGTGDLSTHYFDLMPYLNKNGWVIPGTYRVFQGYFMEGRGDKSKTMVVTPGRAQVINIEAGKMNVWRMGGATEKPEDPGFTFAFKAETRREKGKSYVEIPAKEVKLFGSFGESYESSMFGVPEPLVEISKEKGGSVILREEMRKPDRSDAQQGTDLIFFPKTLTITKSFTGDYFVHLSADFKPLGKVTSEWTPGN